MCISILVMQRVLIGCQSQDLRLLEEVADLNLLSSGELTSPHNEIAS